MSLPPSPPGTNLCTEFALSHRYHPASNHQLQALQNVRTGAGSEFPHIKNKPGQGSNQDRRGSSAGLWQSKNKSDRWRIWGISPDQGCKSVSPVGGNQGYGPIGCICLKSSDNSCVGLFIEPALKNFLIFFLKNVCIVLTKSHNTNLQLHFKTDF